MDNLEIFGIPFLKKGSGIHIKKENRGKFTDYCGGKVTNECILRGKNSSDPKIRKRATFALNSRAWKHLLGGPLQYQGPTYTEVQELWAKEDPLSYNTKQIKTGIRQGDFIYYTDAKGKQLRIPASIGLSGTDPVARDIVLGTVMGKPLLLVGNAALHGLGRAGNTARKTVKAFLGLVQSGKIGKLLLGPDGKIFNSKINYNPNNYYRAVKKDAITDAKITGIIRGSNTSKKVGEGSGPWFGRGKPGFNRDYVIEGTPESAEWIDALKYLKGIIDKLPKVNNNTGAGKTIYDLAFLYGNEGFPMTSGNINQTPASNFIYYKKYPIIGFREKSF